jgi:hypothetical protein
MKLNFKLIVAAIGLSLTATSQTGQRNAAVPDPSVRRTCGTKPPPAAWDAWFNQKVSDYKLSKARGTQVNSVTIPVIVHIIHSGQAVGFGTNLSQAQINSQITVLNDDFAGVGYNSGLLASTGFSAVGAANCNITFCLAQTDPNGAALAEPGIERVNYITSGWASPASFTTNTSFQMFMDGTIKPNTIWDPTVYYNIWVSDINVNCNLLGYATFPGGTSLNGLFNNIGNASTDGIWIWRMVFGTTGNLDPNYNHGRTAVHETGHWLGLRHIGGDAVNPSGDCNATDYCDDTPPQKGGYSGGTNGQNFGAPPYPLNPFVCASNPFGDMFMNFMDYTNDESTYMFTPDQNLRIQTALAEGYFRNQLNASSATLCAGLPVAGFYLDSLGCMDNVSPTNITGGSSPTFSWSVYPNTGVNILPYDTTGNPVISFPSSGTYTVSLLASNNIGLTTSYAVMEVLDCTGIGESSKGDAFRLFPNPSSGLLTIKTSAATGSDLAVIIRNSLGQQVFSENYSNVENNTVRINLQGFPSGVYMVDISTGREKTVRRLLLTE